MKDITYLGITYFRDQSYPFGIKPDDRRRHTYVIGKTGVGKTTLLENMIIQDIQNGQGVGVIDPHGELIYRLLHFIPKERINDVIYFNPGDINWPIAFNVIEEVPKEWRHLIASGLMGVFKKLWPDVWSARMEYILNNSLLALLEYPGSTLLGINRLLSDSDYRRVVTDKITDPVVKAFWEKEFTRYNERYATEAVAPIQNKVGQFISNPLVRNIIGQKESRLDFRDIMDSKKIFLANLSKGIIGEDNSSLLGGLLVTKLQLAAMTRVDLPEEERQDFYLYVDEFQNFSTDSFANIFAEARKYRLNLILAHQYIAQLTDTVREAIFGNIGTLISFRVGPEDAKLLEEYFTPEFMQADLINLPNFTFYIKLMIDGILSKSFSAVNIPPHKLPEISYVQEIIESSRQKYARPSQEVEREIFYWQLLDFTEMAGGSKNIALTNKNKKGIVREGWEAVCSLCGQHIMVPFRPAPNRPVYCEQCFRSLKSQKENAELRFNERDANLDVRQKAAIPEAPSMSLKDLSQADIIKSPNLRRESSVNSSGRSATHKVQASHNDKVKETIQNIFNQTGKNE
ncbi:MAG: AAA-like domain protein [Parcubacteria group bacterium ADurb.Bin305]|jgi:CxxC-x17-CxxC domain-containing protein|nr:type IV secretion system DNA-binding domain-containing protein [Candidatus Paceibacterota bacterium]OQA44380.1 MAG: AAA-like domain protein [Parcubacteria group bacterium ADurb.Bin305]